MVRPTALPAAYAADRDGIEFAASAKASSDVVRGEIESNGLLSLATALESSAGLRGLNNERRARGE